MQPEIQNSMDVEVAVRVSDLMERERLRSALSIIKKLTAQFDEILNDDDVLADYIVTKAESLVAAINIAIESAEG